MAGRMWPFAIVAAVLPAVLALPAAATSPAPVTITFQGTVTTINPPAVPPQAPPVIGDPPFVFPPPSTLPPTGTEVTAAGSASASGAVEGQNFAAQLEGVFDAKTGRYDHVLVIPIPLLRIEATGATEFNLFNGIPPVTGPTSGTILGRWVVREAAGAFAGLHGQGELSCSFQLEPAGRGGQGFVECTHTGDAHFDPAPEQA